MSFHPLRTGLHNFSSINKSYIVILKPFNGKLCLVIGSRSLVIRNTFDIPTPHLSYFIHQQEGYLHFINDLLLTQGTTTLGSHWPNEAVITLCIDENVIIVLYMYGKRAP